jgi:copper chaperone CopZ
MSNKQEIEVSIKGFSCTGCSDRMKKVFEKHEAIDEAYVDYVSGKARVVGNITESEVKQIVEKAGFTPA